MINEVSIDLRVARKKAGLTQADCAHLLGISTNLVSRIECGDRQPGLEEIAILSVLHGKPLEALLPSVILDAARLLSDRLETLPSPGNRWAATYNRHETLSALADRLSDQLNRHGGA